jgi:hypothetical protein
MTACRPASCRMKLASSEDWSWNSAFRRSNGGSVEDRLKPGLQRARTKQASSYVSVATLATTLLCLSAMLSVAGCGDGHPQTVPVTGIVTFADGTPLAGGQIELESVEHRVNARGILDAEGGFRLSTFRDGDGAVVGEHRVIVLPPLSAFAGVTGAGQHGPHGSRPQRVPRRIGDYATSKMTATVAGHEPQRLKIIVPAQSE